MSPRRAMRQVGALPRIECRLESIFSCAEALSKARFFRLNTYYSICSLKKNKSLLKKVWILPFFSYFCNREIK